MATPNTAALLSARAKLFQPIPGKTAPITRARGPYRTETVPAPMRRAAGDGLGYTTDPAKQRALTETERNARRIAHLNADLDRQSARYAEHVRRGRTEDALRAHARISHICSLIDAGRIEGRW